MYKRNLVFITLLCFLVAFGFDQDNQQKSNIPNPNQVGNSKSNLDATKIAGEYFNSIVKILLIDSIAERKKPGTGYLGRGSGVIVSENGYVFTNRHVVDFCRGFMGYTYYDPADDDLHTDRDNYSSKSLKDPGYITFDYFRTATPIIQVYNDKNGNYTLYVAKVVAMDTLNYDGAILKIQTDMQGKPVKATFHAVPIGNSDSTRQGEDLCVYGFPAQYDGGLDMMLKDQSTLTFGKNSGYDYVFNSTYGFIKTDASINGGNSGGPVFNPTNKVIGLASKTVDKTQTGLVGGINGIYNLVALIPDLMVVLKDRGLVPSAKTPAQNSAMVFKTMAAPTHGQIRRSNAAKRDVRNFKGGTWYLTYQGAISNNDKFTYGNIPTFATATNPISVPVTVKQVNTVEIGHLFPIWRIGSYQKVSFDWTILNYSQGSLDWSKNGKPTGTGLVQDTNYSISYLSSAQFTRYSTGFGFTYSILAPRFFIIDLYAKAYITSESITSDASNAIALGNPQRANAPLPIAVLVYTTPTTVLPSVGLNIRKGFLTAGVQYTFGNMRTDFSVNGLTQVTNTAGTGTQTTTPFSGSVGQGQRQIGTLNFTIGLILNGTKKWRDLLSEK